jgi:NitT/TauT family transport system substrate-binding protein
MGRRAGLAAVGVTSVLLVAGCSSSSTGSASSSAASATSAAAAPASSNAAAPASSSAAAPATSAAAAPASSNAAAPASSSAAVATTDIKVGTAPTLSGTTFYLALQNGTFTKNHLSATAQVTTSGAQAIPLLLNGQVQFTVSDAVGAITAISKKIPLEIIAQGPIVSPDPTKDNSGLLVAAGITNVQQLDGKTIAVNALGSFSQLAVEKSIDLAGGDSKKVKYVELPIPQMAAAVKAGTVSGAAISEPFLSQGKAAGLKVLFPILYNVFPNAPMLVYLASTSYASSHPDVVKEFVESLTEANTELGADPATLKTVGASVAKMTPTQIANIILPTYVSTPLSLDSLTNVMNVMVEYKVLAAPIDLKGNVYGP